MDRPQDPASTRVVKQMINASDVSQERDSMMRQRGVRATAQDAGLWRDIVVDKRVSEEVSEQEIEVEAAPKVPCMSKSVAFDLPESATPTAQPFPWKCSFVGLGLVVVALILLFVTRHDAKRHLQR